MEIETPLLTRRMVLYTATSVAQSPYLVRVFHTDAFRLPLPPPHPFPMEKYERLMVIAAGGGGRG